MDLKNFEYQRAEYVKAFKILEYVSVSSSTLPDYLLLDSGMPNMPFAIAVPEDAFHTRDFVGNYFVMHDDGNYEILNKVTFELAYTPKP